MPIVKINFSEPTKLEKVKCHILRIINYFYIRKKCVRLFDCRWPSFRKSAKEFGILKCIYAYDVFFNGVPFFKCLILANVVVWLIMFFTLKK